MGAIINKLAADKDEVAKVIRKHIRALKEHEEDPSSIDKMSEMIHVPLVYRTTRAKIVNEMNKEGVFDILLKMIDECFPEMDRPHMVVATLNFLRVAGQDKDGALLITKKKGLKVITRVKAVFADDEYIPEECDLTMKKIKKSNEGNVREHAKQLQLAAKRGSVAKVVRMFEDSLEVEDVCMVSIDSIYDLASDENHLETLRFHTEGLEMKIIQALLNFPDNKQMYCRGILILTSLLTGEGKRFITLRAKVGKSGGVKVACKALQTFPKSLDVIRQSIWFLDEVLQHDGNVFAFIHENGPRRYQEVLALRQKLDDPGEIFLPKKLKLLMEKRISTFQEDYKRVAKAKAADAKRLAQEKIRLRLAEEEANRLRAKKVAKPSKAEIQARSKKMKDLMKLGKNVSS